ncbi:MAG: FHA domain-containing protein [Anaerolineae bacterium]|nr:FHA domain-containing protein [Anaerolineae bacterium]
MSDPRTSEEAKRKEAEAELARTNPSASASPSPADPVARNTNTDTDPQPPPESRYNSSQDTILHMDLPPELLQLKRQMEARLAQSQAEEQSLNGDTNTGAQGDGEVEKPNRPDEPFQITEEMQTCPRCETPYERGTLVCKRCGMLLGDNGKTRLFNPDEAGALTRTRSMGGGLFYEQQPLVFEVDGERIELPTAEFVVVGRGSGTVEEGEPDVSLARFNATKRGVSRRHMGIRRKGPLIYITDLESTNGTFLNGRRLMKSEERIIRDGDEIHLSHLLIRVSFPDQEEE